ncbi:phage head closure protein [Bacillus sp. B-jedd]|uniref:phage head closure protein n=1 Tax=Bacillus sp. B-jedd TaxID=1476857 RepID=UPI0005155A04|nr:phage head closure protein [Bacillus sp. B-jedd]CEG26008.1 phage head-tail adaptor [Bacillus sp. B-jedd]
MTRYRMNPGELRHIVTFQRKSEGQDSYGEGSDDWVNVLKTRVAIYPISGKEFFAAEKVNSEVTHKVNLRYIPGITSDMRMKLGERVFELISPPINFQEKNIELQLLCKEIF